MAIYETIDRKRAEAKEMKNKSASMEELETPTTSVKSFKMEGRAKAEPQAPVREKRRHRSKSGSKESKGADRRAGQDGEVEGMANFLKKALRIEVFICPAISLLIS